MASSLLFPDSYLFCTIVFHPSFCLMLTESLYYISGLLSTLSYKYLCLCIIATQSEYCSFLTLGLSCITQAFEPNLRAPKVMHHAAVVNLVTKKFCRSLGSMSRGYRMLINVYKAAQRAKGNKSSAEPNGSTYLCEIQLSICSIPIMDHKFCRFDFPVLS